MEELVQMLIFQSMWGMEGLPGEKRDWSVEQQVQAIADAGFAGAGIEIPVYEHAKAAAEALRDLGLKWTIECFPTTVADLADIIEAVMDFGADQCDHINMQPRVKPNTVLEAIPYILGWQAMADDAGLTLYLETHRNRMTTDMVYTLQLIDAIPTVRLTADLSHCLVGREFGYPVSAADDTLIERILMRSSAFHGRVASREQIQVPIGFPHHQQWVDLFLQWWERGFRHWRAGAAPDDDLIFTTELGPPPYAITGADGEELSDRWEETLRLKALVQSLWDSLDTAGT